MPTPSTTAPSVELGALLRRQREAMGMSIVQLARRIGVSRNTVTNYETGKTEPTASDLVRLATALGCAVQELLQADPDTGPPRFAFRAHAALKKDPSVLVAARKFLRAYSEIEEITEARLSNRLLPYVCHDHELLGDMAVEGLTTDLRRECGLHDTGPENIASVLEGLGVRCLFWDFHSPRLDGVSAIQGEMMLIMLKNRHRNVERIIFSGAHELGHLVLHPWLFTSNDDEIDEARDYEREADRFAGCFLVPSNELYRIWREDRLDRLPLFDALLLLKRFFHVSFWCLFHRVRDLGLTRCEYPALVVQTKNRLGIEGKAKVEELEPEPLSSNTLYRTTRFETLVRSAFLQELIGVGKVAEMLQIPVEDAQDRTAKWLRPDHDDLVEHSPV